MTVGLRAAHCGEGHERREARGEQPTTGEAHCGDVPGSGWCGFGFVLRSLVSPAVFLRMRTSGSNSPPRLDHNDPEHLEKLVKFNPPYITSKTRRFGGWAPVLDPPNDQVARLNLPRTTSKRRSSDPAAGRRWETPTPAQVEPSPAGWCRHARTRWSSVTRMWQISPSAQWAGRYGSARRASRAADRPTAGGSASRYRGRSRSV